MCFSKSLLSYHLLQPLLLLGRAQLPRLARPLHGDDSSLAAAHKVPAPGGERLLQREARVLAGGLGAAAPRGGSGDGPGQGLGVEGGDVAGDNVPGYNVIFSYLENFRPIHLICCQLLAFYKECRREPHIELPPFNC